MFDGDDRERILRLIKQRKLIKNAIETAVNYEDFEQFVAGGLMRALELNCEVTELVANRFLQLSREDRARTHHMLQRIRSAEAERDEADPAADMIDASWSTYADVLTPTDGTFK